MRPDTRPLYALAGAGDLVVERLRTLPTRLAALRTEVKVDREDLRHKAVSLPAQVGVLPSMAQAKVAGLGAAAAETYGDLVVRGRTVVRAVSRQRATEELRTDAATTLRRTRAAATAATRTARAAERAVEDGAGKIG